MPQENTAVTTFVDLTRPAQSTCSLCPEARKSFDAFLRIEKGELEPSEVKGQERANFRVEWETRRNA